LSIRLLQHLKINTENFYNTLVTFNKFFLCGKAKAFNPVHFNYDGGKNGPRSVKKFAAPGCEVENE
jgi:hypothetical protein